MNPAAAQYLDGIPYNSWAKSHFPKSRFGHDTSNISESLNNIWRPIRKLHPLRIMDEIWSYCMKTIHDRAKRARTGENLYLASVPHEKMQQLRLQSQRYRVYESGNGIHQVQIPDSGSKYTVNLTIKQCCLEFWDLLFPCIHVLTACRFEQIDPYLFVHKAYTTAEYIATYSNPMLPISIKDLNPDLTVQPPRIVKLRGCPKIRRLRKGAFAKPERRCGNCGQLATHNARSCRAQPCENDEQIALQPELEPEEELARVAPENQAGIGSRNRRRARAERRAQRQAPARAIQPAQPAQPAQAQQTARARVGVGVGVGVVVVVVVVVELFNSLELHF